MNQKPLLSIKKLNIKSGSLQLIKDFNLELSAGDYKVISAPTGTGKTTLFNYIAGILPQAAFEVSGQMEKVQDLRVSYAFQEPRLIPSISVLKNVMLPLQNIMDEQSALTAARQWLTRFNLSTKSNDYPESLSGGEKQRANLARAFAYVSTGIYDRSVVPEALEGPSKNSLLLLDEPFSSQDTGNAQNIQTQIKEILSTPNTAILLITHDHTFFNDNSIIPW